jgi:HEAT repeat protein
VAAAAATIERALGSEDAEERRQATAELGSVPIEAALPLLLAALGDEDWRVRKEATIAARAFASEQRLVDALVTVLGEGDNVGLRNAAVDVLAAAGRAATPALAAAFARLDADGRKLVVETLGKGRDPDAIEALEAALADTDDNVRQGAIEAVAGLGALAPDRVQAILLGRLDDADRVVRLAALTGLTQLEVAIPWARLAPLLDDPALRPAAIAAAALSESPEAAGALAGVLARAKGGAFDQALLALGRLSRGPLFESVHAAILAEGPDLGRRLVTAALPDGGGDDAIDRRIEALSLLAFAPSETPGLVDAAVAALGEDLLATSAQRALAALGEAALPEMLARLGSAAIAPEARAALADVIGDVARESDRHRAEVLDALRAAGRDPEWQVAVHAVIQVARLGGAGDLPLLAEHTLSETRPLAAAAERAFSQLAFDFPAAARALADRLAHDERTLLPAVIAVGAAACKPPFEERDALFLANAATAGDPRVRRVAVDAVAEIRASFGAEFGSALEVLRIALTDEEHDVRLAAARALGKLCTAVDPPRGSDVLDLVDRSGEPDLIAATVRAIGLGLGHRHRMPGPGGVPPPPDDLVPALGLFAGGAPAAVAIAAVEALADADLTGARSAIGALAAALDHPDEGVVRAALYKLAGAAAAARPSADAALAALARGLAHPKPALRARAVELLADVRPEEVRRLLVPRLAVEADRRVVEAIQLVLASPASRGEVG